MPVVLPEEAVPVTPLYLEPPGSRKVGAARGEREAVRVYAVDARP